MKSELITKLKSVFARHPKPKPEPVVLQKHARILREALASLYKNATPQQKGRIDNALLRYKDAVKEYCKHEDSVFVKAEKKFACLDCGKRKRKLKTV